MTELLNASFSRESHAVEIRFEWDEMIQYESSALWSLWVTGRSSQRYQLGYKVVDKLPSAQFVFNHRSARQVNAQFNTLLGDNSLVIRFPARMVEDVPFEEASEMYGTLTIDGQDVSTYRVQFGSSSGIDASPE